MKNTANYKLDIYSLLDIPKTATKIDIKKAFRKMALIVHPDKNPNDPNAGEKFRNLNNAYKILMDDERRALYDETGEYDENETGQVDLENTYNYYRQMYPKIRLEDIENFSIKYKGSDMEKEDLINFYKENKGDVTDILESIPLSRNEDIERFMKFYKDMFKMKKLKKTKYFTQSKSNIKMLEENEEESKEAQEQIDNIAKQIIVNQKKRGNDYLTLLARKYAGRDIEENDIDEEEFQKIQKKIFKKKKEK